MHVYILTFTTQDYIKNRVEALRADATGYSSGGAHGSHEQLCGRAARLHVRQQRLLALAAAAQRMLVANRALEHHECHPEEDLEHRCCQHSSILHPPDRYHFRTWHWEQCDVLLLQSLKCHHGTGRGAHSSVCPSACLPVLKRVEGKEPTALAC